ncbi:MAG TPA: MOSC domain-containing protein [Microscillaceae bacterium]|nr:MOSC domain-containing protein [Microscillaceae bacterium]
MKITLTNLHTYPIKSLQGVDLDTAIVENRGLKLDRRWMITEPDGMFITQRKYPQLALVRLQVTDEALVLEAPEMSRLQIGLTENTGVSKYVQVWSDECAALEVSQAANQWFSDYLKTPLQLMYMPDDTNRLVEAKHNINNHITSFSDGYPFLLISEASLADLNTRLEQPVPMNRFRPNLVVSGTEAYAEDTWKKIRVGEVVFHVAKACSRCVFTTIDQATGEKGVEPLKTLSQYRKQGTKVLFGQNLLQESNGVLKVGDEVEVLEVKS